MSWGVRWDFEFGCIDAICPENADDCLVFPERVGQILGRSRATADEDGHLYEASPVKRFLRELRFLASQEACVCFHGVMVPCLAVLSRSSPNARMGCAFGRKGLTAKARAER